MTNQALDLDSFITHQFSGQLSNR